jgi:PPOX class probable F420-dependent enzyme
MLDLNQTKDAHIDQRLRSEPIIWLSSTRPDGRPHLIPVWFLWDGSTILIFSQPNQQKLRNLRHNPAVVLALDTADQGDDVVLVEGRATLLEDGTVDATLPAFAEKYAALLQRMGHTAEQMAKAFSQAIRITPSKLSGWS